MTTMAMKITSRRTVIKTATITPVDEDDVGMMARGEKDVIISGDIKMVIFQLTGSGVDTR